MAKSKHGEAQIIEAVGGKQPAWHKLRLLAYCLMTNHVHLLAVPEHPEALLLAPELMQRPAQRGERASVAF